MENEKKNPYHKEFGLFSNIRFTISVMHKYSRYLVWMFPLGAVIAVFQRYLWTFLSKFVIDIITKEGDTSQLLKIVAVTSVIMLVFFLLQTWYYNKQWPQCILVRMKMILIKNRLMMTMPFQYTEDPDMMDCCQKAEQAVGGNNDGIEGMEHNLFSFVEQLGIVIAGLIILGTMNPLVVVGMSVLGLLNFLISNRANKWSKANVWDPLAPWWRKRWYMNHVLGNFDYAKDIRMFGLKDWLRNKFVELNKERYEAQRINNKLWFWVGVASNILWLISQAAIYAYLIYQVFQKSITIGNFSLYLASAGTFFECISSLLNSVTSMLQKSRQIDDYRSYLEVAALSPEAIRDYNPEEKKAVKSAERKLQKVPKFEKYEFEFQNVSFKYPRCEKYALKNLNIKVKAGERLAVVGLNGAGKSTFIKLMLRLYEPTEGKILLNGVDVSTYDVDSYYSIFAPVFQEVNLFAFTLAENVAMQTPEEIDREFVQQCVDDSGLDQKREKLSAGLDTQLLKVIYDEGVDLSGGEKQKLALARALYKNAPVVVLDEPTAALDAIAESKLYSDFDKLIGGKTSIYISHRLSSTQFCNYVAMFKDGQMIEYGTHASLMQQNGEYAYMFRVQSQYYVEEQNENN